MASNHKNTTNKGAPRSFFSSAPGQILLTAALMFILFGASFFIAYRGGKQRTPNVPQVASYEDCTKLPGSVIQESYPSVCVTQDGKRFTQDLSKEDNKFCGGIANIACPEGFTCRLDGDYPDAGGTCVKN